jgi:hypothetical protein
MKREAAKIKSKKAPGPDGIPNKTPTNLDAYRPICMLDGLGKLLEKILVDRIMK